MVAGWATTPDGPPRKENFFNLFLGHDTTLSNNQFR
jgi:hypothetical protein